MPRARLRTRLRPRDRKLTSKDVGNSKLERVPFLFFRGKIFSNMTQTNRYYLYYSSSLVIMIVSRLLGGDLLYIASFLFPVFFAMLFMHPNVDNFKEYKISRFSFVNLLFYLQKRFLVREEISLSKYLNRHLVGLGIFVLLTIPMTVNFFILYLSFLLGVAYFEIVYYFFKKKKALDDFFNN